MGTPAPYTNLTDDQALRPVRPGTMLGTVTSVRADGKRAKVDIAGTEWTVSIPGSVHGVKEGRSVSVRTEGNVRTLVAVVSSLATPAYSGNPSRVVRGPTTSPPSPPSGVSISIGQGSVTLVNLIGSGGTVDQLRASVNNRYSYPINSNFMTLQNEIDSHRQALNTLVNAVNTIMTAIGQSNASINSVRDKVDTIAADLRDNTGILGE